MKSSTNRYNHAMGRLTTVVLLLALGPIARAQVIWPALPGGLGVNIHFTDPKPGEMKLLADAGFALVRMDLTWSRIESKKGEYDFSAYDRLTKECDAHGLRVLFILDYSNKLYDDGLSPHTDEGRAAFARWAAESVKHFKNKRIIWEIYNEPNIDTFWKPKANSADYVKLALAAGKAMKDAAPGEVQIGPACSGVDLAFLEDCVKAGLLEYWSAVSVHPYRQQDPETVADDYRALRMLIRKYGPKDKQIPIFCGEWGYSSAWSGMDDDAQARLLSRQWLTNIMNDVPVSIWYDWRDDGNDPKDPEHHFGTTRNDATTKPAYLAAKTLTTQLHGLVFNKRI
ncbi:MAG TPA: cellulase family glycosylhydrolase, partial [Tepidisphaeraceae bacterium]